MKKQKNIFIVFLLLFSLNSVAIEDKTVLILHSYNKELSWTDNLNSAIVKKLYSSPDMAIDIRIEYMDTKRFEDQPYLESLAKHLLYKYSNTQLDLIISTDNAAFEFLKEYQNRFVKKTPVVFCGLNYVDTFPEGFTGIVEDIDIVDNIQAIQSIHPNYKKIYIAIDNSITGKAIKQQAIKIIEEDFPNLRYEYITDYSYDDLKTKLSSLEPGDIFLLVIFNYDKNGLVIPYDNILQEIKPYCQVPIYGTWDFYLNKGIVGGKITSAQYHGEEAGEIALKILHHNKPSEIPVRAGATKYIFDFTYLKEQNIKIESLPKGSIILNKPVGVIAKNKELFGLVMALFLLLTVIIIFLILIVRREKKALAIERLYLNEIESKKVALTKALNEANQANSLQRSFLSNLSHEIRTPMNGILGFSDLLSELEFKNSIASKYIEHINTNGNLLLSIIDDILEISRIETKKTEINIESVNLNKIITEVINTLSLRTKKLDKIELKADFSLKDENANIETDATKLKQILSNLIDNAIKFTAEGSILVRYSITNNNEIEFCIQDTGIGISSENFDHIFSRFGQVEKGLSRKYGGTGLGLSITKAFIELLGGKIWLVSELGSGTTFYFTHPANFSIEKIPEVKPVSSSKYNWEKLTVLIAEDERLNYEFLKAVLKPTQINILYAENGLEALELCRACNNIDIILMDLKMPEMDGFEASKKIRNILPDIPIIAQTAYAQTYDFTKAQEIGFDGKIFKPINKNELLGLMNKFFTAESV